MSKTGKKIMATFCVVFVMAMMGLSSVFAETQIPDRPQEYVRDEAGILSDREMSNINKALADHDRKTRNRIDVLLVRTTGGESVGDYTNRVMSAWRTGTVGRNQEPDAVIVVASDDGKIAAKTGDVMAKTVSESDISDIMKGKRVKAGINDGDWASAVQGVIAGFRNADVKSAEKKKATGKTAFSILKDGMIKFVVALLIVIAFRLFVVVLRGGDVDDALCDIFGNIVTSILFVVVIAVVEIFIMAWRGLA